MQGFLSFIWWLTGDAFFQRHRFKYLLFIPSSMIHRFLELSPGIGSPAFWPCSIIPSIPPACKCNPTFIKCLSPKVFIIFPHDTFCFRIFNFEYHLTGYPKFFYNAFFPDFFVPYSIPYPLIDYKMQISFSHIQIVYWRKKVSIKCCCIFFLMNLYNSLIGSLLQHIFKSPTSFGS